MKSEQRRKKLLTVLSRRQPDLTIVMENIHDPHNVSAMFRSADAVGIAQVQLLYTKEKFPKIGKKSSSSANKWVEQRKFASVEECYTQLRKEGFFILATRLDEQAYSIYSYDLASPIALVFGNEHSGVSEEAAALADAKVMIPMVGMIQSLNVSVACGVCLFEALRQRLQAGKYEKPSFPQKQLHALYGEWLEK
ncbi:MAG: RNA methyltransferase [Bacteroidota bacterium]|nr:RNA methyltransferase [Bacteroidota bacterium]